MSEAVEKVEREVTLSFRDFSALKKAGLYAHDTIDDENTPYGEAVENLVRGWNEATEAARGEADG